MASFGGASVVLTIQFWVGAIRSNSAKFWWSLKHFPRLLGFLDHQFLTADPLYASDLALALVALQVAKTWGNPADAPPKGHF